MCRWSRTIFFRRASSRRLSLIFRTFWKKKWTAIRAHASQFYDPNSNELETRLTDKNFIVELENRSRYFGSLIGVAAGEPFFVREAIEYRRPD